MRPFAFFLMMLAALAGSPALDAAVTRQAYLQMSAPTAISVRWRTDVSEVGRVRWGAAPGSLTEVLDEPAAATNHEIRITGLSPSTRYYYSIGNASTTYAGGDVDHRFDTHPNVGQAGAYRFWVIGDAGTQSAAQNNVRNAFYSLTASSGVEADLWLQLGDNAYNNGTDAEFQAKNFDIYPTLYRQKTMFSCIGNHEGTGTGYYPAYTFPTAGESGGTASGTEAYYSVDYGNVHFISLDSQNSSRAVGGAMYNWLVSDLQNTTQTWIVVLFHHPPYTKGSHDSDTEGQLVQMRQNFNPVFEQYGVDLVLAGHSHSYERSAFIDGHYGVSSTFNPALKSSGGHVVQAGFGRPGTDGAYIKYPGANTGAVYAVPGSSGQISGGSLNHAAHLVSLNLLGSLVLDVNGGQLNATFLRETGAVDDSFSLVKGVLGSPTSTPTFTDSPTISPTHTETPDVSATPTPTTTVTFSVSPTFTPGPVAVTVVAQASVWKYRDLGTDLLSIATPYFQPAHDDSAWASGTAPLGYDDAWINTVISFGPDGNNKYRTTYFRKTFSVGHLPSDITSLMLRANFDDGFVLYLNGLEALRSGISAGAYTHQTFASSHEGGSYQSFDLTAHINKLGVGANLIAVDVHQTAATSSDLSWDADLVYTVSSTASQVTATETATASPTFTSSPSSTASPDWTATASPTSTPTNTETPDWTATETATPSATATASPTPTPYTGTVLGAGDVAFIGFRSNSTGADEFAVVLLTDIVAGTYIKFTDRGWHGDTVNAFCAACTAEQTYTWAATADMAAGTVLRFIGLVPNQGILLSSVNGTLALATGADQILAYQGEDASPVFLAALQTAAATWLASGIPGTGTSYLPAGLVNGGTALAITAGTRNNGMHNCRLSRGNAAALRTHIHTAANWVLNNTATWTLPWLCPFNLGEGGTPVGDRAAWRYHNLNQDLGTAWKAVTYDDSAWLQANAPLGTESTATYHWGAITPINIGTNPNKYPTLYFRKAFTPAHAPAQVTRLYVRVLYDDGYVVHLNGVEVARNIGSAGPIGFSYFTDPFTHEADNNSYYEVVDISAHIGLLQAGTNVLAVEVHNDNGSSSDLVFDAELLYAANGPAWTATPSPSATPSSSMSASPTETPALSPTDTETAAPFASSTESPTGSLTATVSATASPSPTATSSATAVAGTALSPGDLAFVGYAASGTTADQYRFVLLKAIVAGTQIHVTDKGWDGIAAFATGEASYIWTADQAYPLGTEVTVNGLATAVQLPDGGAGFAGPALTLETGSGAMGMSTGGESLLAFTGSLASPNFVAGLIVRTGGWLTVGVVGGSTSYLPAALLTGQSAMALNPFQNGGLYSCGVYSLADLAALRGAIHTPANWTTNILNPWDLTPGCAWTTAAVSPTATRTPTPLQSPSDTATVSSTPTQTPSATPALGTATPSATPSPATTFTASASPTVGTSLAAGDAAFTGYVSSNPDAFSFVVFRDIVAGTQIHFTDKGWMAGGGLWTGGDASATWTATQDLIAGTQVLVYNGFTTNTGTVTGSNIGLSSTNGDQITLYQGDLNSPVLIAMIHMNGDWDADAVSAETSARPGPLTDGLGNCLYCIAPAIPEADDAVYNCSVAGTAGLAALKAAVFNPANWISGDSAQYSLPPACSLVDGTATFTPTVSPAFTPTLTPTPDQNLVLRGPYLQKAGPAAVTIRWRTQAGQDSMVRYGASPATLNQSASVAALVTEHSVTVTGLNPDTLYYYSVGSSSGAIAGGTADYSFRTHPVAGVQKNTRVWVMGDAGIAPLDGGANQRAVRDAYNAFAGSTPSDLVLQLGDNAYNNGTDSEYQIAMFQNMYEAALRRTVFWPTLGNHESDPAYFSIYDLPTAAESGGTASGTENYYSFDYGDIHFICLDSQLSSRAVGGAMYNWLQSDLQNSTARWIVAFWHHPPYSKGSHDSDPETQLVQMRTNFLPLLESYGVDLVLSGHSHVYERSRFIDGHYGLSGTFNPALQGSGGHVVQAGNGRPGSDGAYVKSGGANTGVVYAVAGSSGEASGGPLNHPAHIVSLNVLGSMVLDFSDGRLDASFVSAAGTVQDSFSVVKAAASPSPTHSTSPTPSPTSTLGASSPTVSPSPTASPSASPSLTATPTQNLTVSPPTSPAPTAATVPLVGPNPVRLGQPLCLDPPSGTQSTDWILYAVDGTRVADLGFQGGARSCWTTQDLAPGVYFARVRCVTAGAETVKTYKIAVVR